MLRRDASVAVGRKFSGGSRYHRGMLPSQRRKQAMRAAAQYGADALLVTASPDVRWLSGFTGSSAVIALRGGRAALFTDGRYTIQAKAEAPDLKVYVKQRRSAVALALEWLVARGATRCAFDARQTTVAAYEAQGVADGRDPAWLFSVDGGPCERAARGERRRRGRAHAAGGIAGLRRV